MKENLLDKYLKNHSVKESFTSYYCNVLNNNEDFSKKLDEYHPDCLIREKHNYCNLTVIDWMNYGNNFKGYDDRRWYYVIETHSDDKTVQIRQDLIDKWKENNAKDNVLILNTKTNQVWDIPMQRFFGYKPLPSKINWNNEGNVILKFDLLSEKPTFTDKNPDEIENAESIEYLMKIWDFIGNVSYAKHRTNDGKMYLVADYNEQGYLKSYHKMKSKGQMYDLLNFSNFGSKRNFNRNLLKILNAEKISCFITNADGITFWISEDTNIKPPKSCLFQDVAMVTSTVEVNENEEILVKEELETIAINVDAIVEEILKEENMTKENIYEKAIEKATEIINDSEVKRIINRPEPLKIGTVNDTGYNDWLRMVDEMNVKPKRIIIRG